MYGMDGGMYSRYHGGANGTADDQESQQKQRDNDSRLPTWLILLLLLLLCAVALFGTFGTITGALSLHDTYAYDGVIPTIDRQLDVLEANATVYEQELQDMNNTVCNTTALLNLTCAHCVNSTLLVVNNTLVNRIHIETLIIEFIYIVNATDNVTYNLVVTLDQIYNETLVLQQILDAIQCIVNGTITSAGVWDDTTTYGPLVFVSSGNYTWLSLIDNNVNNTPGADNTIWAPLTGVGPPGDPGDIGPPGPPGNNGTDGTPCFNGTAGSPALLASGNWSVSDSYVPNSMVTHNGSTYIARVATTGDEPGVNTTAWYLYVEMGDPGSAGPDGGQGNKGPYANVTVYDNATAYVIGQLVNFNGTLYLAQANSTGVDPGTDGNVWTVIGAPGGQGPPGANGTDGSPCYAVTMASFTQPAVGVNVTVNVNKVNVQVNQRALLVGGGLYYVMAIPSSTSLVLQYTNASDVVVSSGGTVTNATRVFPVGRPKIGPAGPQGPAGNPGSNGTVEIAVSPMGFRASICPSCTSGSVTTCSVLQNGVTRVSYLQMLVRNNTASNPSGDYVLNSTMLVGGNYSYDTCASSSVLGGCCGAGSTSVIQFSDFTVTKMRLYGGGAYSIGVELTVNASQDGLNANLTGVDVTLVATNTSPSVPSNPYEDRWISMQIMRTATGSRALITWAATDHLFIPNDINYVDYALRVNAPSFTYDTGGAGSIVAYITGGHIYAQRL